MIVKQFAENVTFMFRDIQDKRLPDSPGELVLIEARHHDLKLVVSISCDDDEEDEEE